MSLISNQRPRLLDLYCCAGGAAMGYYRAGFDVVGVDIAPQPHFPFTFIQADALEYVAAHGHEFDAIHASPPCQGYSVTRAIHGREYVDLVDATRDALDATGKPYIIENVPGAPLRNAIYLEGMMFGLRVIRRRLFESNLLLLQPSDVPAVGSTNSHRGYSTGGAYITVAGNNYNRIEGMAAMGVDWHVTRRELSQATPPAYTEFTGRQLLTALAGQW